MRLYLTTIIFLASSFALAKDVGLGTVRKNNHGVELLNSEKYYKAEGKIIEGLEKDPFNPVLHFNLGMAFLKSAEYEKAIKEFVRAEKLAKEEDRTVNFLAAYNVATITWTDDVAKALKYYQKALDLNLEGKSTDLFDFSSRESARGGLAQSPPGKMSPKQKAMHKKILDFYIGHLMTLNLNQLIKNNMEILMNKGGGGGKSGQQQQQKKEDEGDGDQDRDRPMQNRRDNHPQPYKGKELTEQDVKKILEELKQQEEKIRAKNHDKGGAPEGNFEKDW
jgi:tetratricopeptide (TPR) repeat protein